MLTNLNFIQPGRPWPPVEEKERLETYKQNRDIFEGKHEEVYKEQFKRIERVIGNFREVISYPVIINYQKKVSLKIADLLLGEPPRLIAGDPESDEQETLNEVSRQSELFNTCYEAALDVSRYGNALFNVHMDEESARISLTPPSLWFPVVSPDNIKKILFHVLAWSYHEEIAGRKEKFLKVQVHEKGRYTEKIFRLQAAENHSLIHQTIGSLIEESIIQTGLKNFAIVPVSNVVTSDRIFGIDDYMEIDSIVSEILIRVAQVSRILDKHAAPSVQGPASALEQDPATGRWKLKMGNYFPRNDAQDPPVEYITWDAQLSANFKQIENLVNNLYTISEMGSAIFGDLSQKQGQIPSGSALKRLMIAPLAKVNRIRMRFDPALTRALALASQIGGPGIIALDERDISIHWQDGLPGDPREEAEIINYRTAGRQTMSARRAIKTFDGLTEEDAENELSTIQDEEVGSNPIMADPFQGEKVKILQEEVRKLEEENTWLKTQGKK